MAKKFRKLPVAIEAEQLTAVYGEDPPEGVLLALGMELPWYQGDADDWVWYVETLEGPLICTPGDWIITGIKGEKYPCKPDIFEATYEAVDE